MLRGRRILFFGLLTEIDKKLKELPDDDGELNGCIGESCHSDSSAILAQFQTSSHTFSISCHTGPVREEYPYFGTIRSFTNSPYFVEYISTVDDPIDKGRN